MGKRWRMSHFGSPGVSRIARKEDLVLAGDSAVDASDPDGDVDE